MAPRFAEVDGLSLYLYYSEPHQRPHIAVRRGRQSLATVDIETGDVIAGELSAQEERNVRGLLEEHRDAFRAAFEKALRHEDPGTLESSKTPTKGGEDV